jgi:hypothetical protein
MVYFMATDLAVWAMVADERSFFVVAANTKQS